MTGEPGVDHPEVQTEAEVSLTGRGVSVTARVELVQGDVVSVRPSASGFFDQVMVAAGDAVELFWKTGKSQRMLPARVITVEQGAVVRWRLEATGPAETSQRRNAVRGRLAVPVEVGFGPVELTGRTIDLSEDGLRAEFDGFGVPPEAGLKLDLVVTLDDGPLRVPAAVVRTQTRGAQWVMSIRFTSVEERDQDRIRRRVFQALREERARMADDSPPGLRG